MTSMSVDGAAAVFQAAVAEFGQVNIKIADLHFWDHLREDPKPVAAAWTADDNTLWLDTRCGPDLETAFDFLAQLVAQAAADRADEYHPLLALEAGLE